MTAPGKCRIFGNAEIGQVGILHVIQEYVGRFDVLVQPATQQAHNQVSGVRLTPVVVQRHDVRMLQPGDQMRLRLKAANEGRVVGKPGQDNLHGHVPLHRRLHGAIDDTEATGADPLGKLQRRP